MDSPFEAFFLSASAGRSGQRFCLFHPAHGSPRGAVVHVHAFAEEMNKSRRMVALQARAMAQAGYAVLQIDLLGCGDSSGEFEDATWDDWVADVEQAACWLRDRVDAPLWLWGLRAGALIACQAAQRLQAPCNFLFWQPATLGKQVLQQFLRLKTARDMIAGEGKGAAEALRRDLAQGRAVEIAGYRLPAALAAGLESAQLKPAAPAHRSVWIELAAKAETSLTPAVRSAIEGWSQAGWAVQAHALQGPAFWQTAEIETVPALLPLTLAALQQEEAVAA